MIKRFSEEEISSGKNRIEVDGIAVFAEEIFISIDAPSKIFVHGILFNDAGEVRSLICAELETNKPDNYEKHFFDFKNSTEADLEGLSGNFLLKSPWNNFVVIR